MGNQDIIMGLLRDNPQGLTIQELSSRSKLNRVIVSNVLAEFKGAGKVRVRAVGIAKLHFWNKEMSGDGL
jgi:hypothetical protein